MIFDEILEEFHGNKMPPSSNGPEINDSILEPIWKITIEFLLNHGFLVQRTIKNLSINQIKTIYNLHIKHEVNILREMDILLLISRNICFTD